MSKSSAAARTGRMSRTSRTPSRTGSGFGRRSRGQLAAIEMFTRPGQSWPVMILLGLWRWRWELLWLAAGIAAYLWISAAQFSTAELVLLAEIPIAVLAIPFTRTFVFNRVWCVITRHRLRLCLAEMRAMNHSGHLPLILACRSTKVGEAVWLWLRPGLSITDLANQTETIAVACWAGDVRVSRHKRLATLVRVEVIRRDPLTDATVANPLTLLRTVTRLPAQKTYTNLHTGAAFSPRVPGSADPEGLFVDDPAPQHQQQLPESKPARKRPFGQARPTTPPGTSPVIGHNGEDITDYV
jgi:hypothetical protein